ncbi:MAG: hypothetical protein HOP29_15775 [Phycisphaerales bacterium]|nr:hypothetical protein [Phycisphaerales bacterium]
MKLHAAGHGYDAAADADTLHRAAELNRHDPLRDGAMLRFPDYGQVVMTGDLHGHERNFSKLQRYADLGNTGARHVILHELIHADVPGDDLSHRVLVRAARWKTEFPDQVHFLQSNHELSQLTGKEICKGGRIVTFSFEAGVATTYGKRAGEVLDAVMDYIESLPVAARTANRILLSHSLPNANAWPVFDATALKRLPLFDDFNEGGPVYSMVWGRYHTPDLLDEIARAFNVDCFIVGHQPQESGYDVVHGRMIILASDHDHGVFLPFDLKKTQTVADLTRLIRPCASIA